MSDSPYQPPLSTQKPENKTTTGTDTSSILPFAQLGLRLLGVMLTIDGIGAIFGGVIQGLLQAKAYADAGYAVPLDPHSAGWAAGGIPHIVAGVYLIVSGNWVLDKVFTPSNRADGNATVESGEPDDARESPN